LSLGSHSGTSGSLFPAVFAAEWRGSDSEAGELARKHIARIRDLFRRLCDEAGVANPASVADQLVLLLEGAIMLCMTRAAEDPAGDARAAAAALLKATRREPSEV
jgi:hypothetical protein